MDYTLDLNTGLTQVLSESAPQGYGTTDYLYGNGRIAQVNTTTEFFLGDALGSVRQMTDSTGEVTFARGYDPGVYPEPCQRSVVTSTTGASLTEFGFTGGQYDSYINLLDCNSRHCDPELGRFISPDSIVPGLDNP
jgi:RHS repeat-associated protein